VLRRKKKRRKEEGHTSAKDVKTTWPELAACTIQPVKMRFILPRRHWDCFVKVALPSLSNNRGKHTFRRAPDFPDLALWCEENVELEITKPSSDIISRWVIAKGWKGKRNEKKMRVVSSMILLFDVAEYRSNQNRISGAWNGSTY